MKQILFNLFLFTATNFLFAVNPPKDPIAELPLIFTKATRIDNFTTRIPFKLVDRLIMIEGNLQNQKGNFLIDTGSKMLILNKVHFKNYLFTTSSNNESYGVLGTVENTLEKRIKNLSFKGLILKNKNSHLINLSHIEESKKIKLLGIIGFDILKDYEVFIDLYLNQITLTKVDKTGKKLGNTKYLEKIVDSIDFQLKNHTIVVPALVNNQKLLFGIDSGAEFNQLNTKVNQKVFKHFYPKKRIKLTGISSKKVEVIYGDLYRLKLNDNIYFGPMKTIVTNLKSMNKAFGTKLDGILGHDFFAQKRVIINYKKEKIYFIKYPLPTN